jgi:hypothetical protein
LSPEAGERELDGSASPLVVEAGDRICLVKRLKERAHAADMDQGVGQDGLRGRERNCTTAGALGLWIAMRTPSVRIGQAPGSVDRTVSRRSGYTFGSELLAFLDVYPE